MIVAQTIAEFNSKYASSTGISFHDNEVDDLKVDVFSVEYPALKFHFEFWLNDDLYICLHADHRQTHAFGPVSNENLVMKIGKFGNYILEDIKKHFDHQIYGDLDLEGENDKLNSYNTHKLNFLGRMDDPAYNAELMYHLIKAAKKFRI
ncbi:MAG: hypothetical protein ACM3ME_00785 [Chloroflexota bacterium]|nr:hypothetical protein [Lentimicrobium sp.]